MSGLPAAVVHNDVNKLLHKYHRVPSQRQPQQPDQGIFIQANEAQTGHDDTLRCGCFPAFMPKELPQLSAQPGQQGLKQIWVFSEERCPGAGLMGTHRTAGRKSCGQ